MELTLSKVIIEHIHQRLLKVIKKISLVNFLRHLVWIKKETKWFCC